MKGWVLSATVALLLVVPGLPAQACQLCLGGLRFAPGQQLDVADRAVLAAPMANGRRWRIIEVVKGPTAPVRIVTEPVDGADREAIRSGSPMLLLSHVQWPRWTAVGTISAGYAGWLRKLITTGPAADRPDIDWRARLALVTPHLEDPEPLAAAIAYGELARAPYGAMRGLRPRLDAAAIAKWLDDPRLADRRPAYTLLLGIAGGPADAERLEQRLEAAWVAGAAINLGAMLAANLELRGPSRVAWIEARYLSDRDRTMPEIVAAVEALAEQGDVDAVVPRARVIQAYLLLLRDRKPLAPFVAGHLAEWEYWGAAAQYAALLASSEPLDASSRGAIVAYLERCPCPEATGPLGSPR